MAYYSRLDGNGEIIDKQYFQRKRAGDRRRIRLGPVNHRDNYRSLGSPSVVFFALDHGHAESRAATSVAPVRLLVVLSGGPAKFASFRIIGDLVSKS